MMAGISACALLISLVQPSIRSSALSLQSLLEVDDAFYKDTDDAECGRGWNATEGAELSHLLNRWGRMPRGWVPSASQRHMCDEDTRRRIASFAPWDYSPSTTAGSAAAGSETPYYSRAATAPPPTSDYATEFHDDGDGSGGGDPANAAVDGGGGGGDGGALYSASLGSGRRALSEPQLRDYRARLGHFLAAFARVSSAEPDAAQPERDRPEIVRRQHLNRPVYTGGRGRGPFDYESELDRDRPEP
jgi:hypothetical protein